MEDLMCGLIMPTGMKFAFPKPPTVRVNVLYGNLPLNLPARVTYLESDSQWHWQISPPLGEASQVNRMTLVIEGDAPSVTLGTFVKTFTLHVGDGTRRPSQGGCSLATFMSAVSVGPQHEIPIKVPVGANSISVKLSGLCGLVRDDSRITLESAGNVLKRNFLPRTSNERDLSFVWSDLVPGDYVVRLASGTNPDIDDFILKSLTLGF
jgi:hypothetical protein